MINLPFKRESSIELFSSGGAKESEKERSISGAIKVNVSERVVYIWGEGEGSTNVAPLSEC